MLDEPTINVSARAVRELLADAKHAGDKAFMDGDKFGQVWHSAQCHAYKLLLEMQDQ